jgi:hypothetical protein
MDSPWGAIGDHVKTATTTVLLLFLYCPIVCGQSARGTVCVGPVSPERPTIGQMGGFYNPATLTVRIDKGQPIIGPHKECIKIGDLDLSKRHLVVVSSDGKPIQSLWFRFSGGSTDLCLMFDSYDFITLNDLSEKKYVPWCRCK